jgi:hypothetical protein
MEHDNILSVARLREGPAGAGPSRSSSLNGPYGLTLTIVEPISLLPSL